jgi:hypothetical protein
VALVSDFGSAAVFGSAALPCVRDSTDLAAAFVGSAALASAVVWSLPFAAAVAWSVTFAAGVVESVTFAAAVVESVALGSELGDLRAAGSFAGVDSLSVVGLDFEVVLWVWLFLPVAG